MLTLRAATMVDAADLYAWRNDPVTRAMSLCTDEVRWSDHLAWLKRSIDRTDVALSIAETEGTPVGTVRLDYGAEVELSMTIAPEHRARTYPRAILKASIPPNGCVARVKRSNVICRGLIAIFGFRMVEDGAIQIWRHPGHSSTTSKKLAYTGEPVPPPAKAAAVVAAAPMAAGLVPLGRIPGIALSQGRSIDTSKELTRRKIALTLPPC